MQEGKLNHLISSTGPHKNGPEKKPTLVLVTTIPLTLHSFFKGQIMHLKNKGFQVVAVSSGGEELDEFGRKERVSVHEITMTRGISPVADLIAGLRLWVLFQKLKPTIVHGSTPKAGVLSMMAATLAKVPVKFYTLRGAMTEMRRGLAGGLLKMMEWTACALADRVLAVSRSVMDGVVFQRLCSEQKIKVLEHGSSNGVDAVNRFNPANIDQVKRGRLRSQFCGHEDAVIIGFVGRLVKDKGVVELASAWKRIRNACDNTCLLMIGPREPHNPVPRDILEELSRDDRVIMLDFVANGDLPNYYAIMDIVVLPTYREGFPNVVLEAAAMGLPVVAAKVTGCVDAVADGVTGKLVAPRDVQSLVEAISHYVQDRKLRLNHGQAGRERVLKYFRPEPIWEALFEEYHSQMHRKGILFPSISQSEPTEPVSLPEKGSLI
jgi:glycosyltransferase involved in cell wall biosynthesis